MRIATLEPFLTELLVSFGAEGQLCAVSHGCGLDGSLAGRVVVTEPRRAAERPTGSQEDEERLMAGLCSSRAVLSSLVQSQPDLVLAQVSDPAGEQFVAWAQGILERKIGKRVALRSFAATSMMELYAMFEGVAEVVGKGWLGRELAQRTKAQIQDWTRNFYERARNKRVTVLSSVAPLALTEGLVADLVRVMTGQPQERSEGLEARPFGWAEVVQNRSDVVIVAPCGSPLEESVKTLQILEKLPDWESVPAVKRGEVVFCEGARFYQPGPHFLRTAAVVISAMAGLDSGYITQRDEYFRLRFLELHRHRFV